jgi:hypothetical protein
MGLLIIQWNGSRSTPAEKLKGGEVARAINAERNSKGKVSVVDEGSETEQFWQLLSGRGPISQTQQPSYRPNQPAERRLFRLSDASGKMTFTQVGSGRLSRSMLDGSDVFIVDNGTSVFAWVGSKASPQERRSALSYASNYLNQFGRPPTTHIAKVTQGRESEEFEASFH